MRVTIHSRSLGKLDFFMPHSGGYVRLETEGKEGTLAPQICEGGGFMGSTITATPDSFKKVCTRWYKQRLKLMQSIMNPA